MSAEFHNALLPPQTLETLDNWGSLDSLPFSLDSSAWTTAGIYNLSLAEQASAGGAAGLSRLLALSGSGSVTTSQEATVGRVVHIAGAGAATVGESCNGLRARLGAGQASATTASVMEGMRQTAIPLSPVQARVSEDFTEAYRIRTDSVAAEIKTGQIVEFLRYRFDAFEDVTQAFGKLDPTRILHIDDSEPGVSGESFIGYRVRPHSGELSASSGQAVTALRIRQDVTSSTAKVAENVTVLRIRTQSAKETATASANALLERVRSGGGASSATSSESGLAYLVRGLAGQSMASASGKASGNTIRDLQGVLSAITGGSFMPAVVFHIAGESTATTSGSAFVARVVHGAVSGYGNSASSVVTTYKGWNWDSEKTPSAPVWEQKAEELNRWTQTGENVAEWAAQNIPAQGWIQKHGGMATWQ